MKKHEMDELMKVVNAFINEFDKVPDEDFVQELFLRTLENDDVNLSVEDKVLAAYTSIIHEDVESPILFGNLSDIEIVSDKFNLVLAMAETELLEGMLDAYYEYMHQRFPKLARRRAMVAECLASGMTHLQITETISASGIPITRGKTEKDIKVFRRWVNYKQIHRYISSEKDECPVTFSDDIIYLKGGEKNDETDWD